MSKSYESYKDTADRWFPPAPSHWVETPLWTMFTRTARKGFEDETLLSVYRDHGVVPKASRDDNFNRASEDLSTYQLVEPGDLVINKMKAWQGSLSISRYRGIVSPAYFVYRPHHEADDRFLHHLLRAQPMIGAYIGGSKGVRINQWDLDPQNFSRLKVAMPPVAEQREIADFLDRETAKIDAMVAEQQGLVDVLRERRSALVSHVVASGMNSSAGTKGVEVGAARLEVPSHWPVLPLRFTIAFQEGPGILTADFREDGVPLLRISGVRNAVATLDGCNFLDPDMVSSKWSHFRVRMGDLLISASATVGTVSEVTTEDVVGAIPYTGIIRIIPGAMSGEFIRWFVVSSEFLEQVEALKTGSTIQHFGPSHLSQMRVALPPVDEQRQIAAYLDEQTARIDILITEAEGVVVVARERRSALITAAVTGQIDVRGEVA